MNETVTIKEGSLTRRLAPIDKLKINTMDNKQSAWVPADKSNTGVLHAGYTAVFVNVPHKTITGIDRNDGKTYEISLDGNGNIVKREVTT